MIFLKPYNPYPIYLPSGRQFTWLSACSTYEDSAMSDMREDALNKMGLWAVLLVCVGPLVPSAL